MLSRHTVNDPRNNRTERLTPLNHWKPITAKAHEAIRSSGEGWTPESDLKIHLVHSGLPISFRHTGFKSIEVMINMPIMTDSCINFARATDSKSALVITEQIVYSSIRLWTGHYNHCPYDSWRHQNLCDASAVGGFGTTDLSHDQRILAEAVTSFFEKSIVSNIIGKEEGDSFAEGIIYEYLVNRCKSNLLTSLFFLSQSFTNPRAWKAVLTKFSIPQNALAEALLPEVLKIIFGLCIIRDGQNIKVIPHWSRRYSSWTEQVAHLAELLIPYLCENERNSTPEPYPSQGHGPGQGDISSHSQNTPEPAREYLGQLDNPFVSSPSENPQIPQGAAQSTGPLPGRSSPPPPRYNLQQLDSYYSQRASAVVIEAQNKDKKKPKKPELLPVGFLSSEEVSFSALLSSQIAWFRTMYGSKDEQNQLRLYSRTDPLKVPHGNDELSGDSPQNLLLLIDSSGSMKFNPSVPSSSGRRGKYDLVLLSCYGIFKHIEFNNLADDMQVACINFSGNSIESGWHPFSEMVNFNGVHRVKETLLTYQSGGTILNPAAIRRAFDKIPSGFLAIIITDGGLGNTPAAVSELRKVVQSGCDLFLLHIGQENAFTKAINEMNCSVKVLNSAKDLVGLSLQIAKKRFS